MSFFGFDATLPRDRAQNPSGPSFAHSSDAFAGLSRPADDDEDAIDFEDTYDGLGEQLDETDDVFNDDTFGDSSSAPKAVGKDFDFFGQTAQVADAITEEQLRFVRQQPAPKPAPYPTSFVSQSYAKPAKTGYERYKDPGYLQDLQADEDLWGDQPKKLAAAPVFQPSTAPPAAAPGRKVMSLEEVEALMRAQAKRSSQPVPIQVQQPQQIQEHQPMQYPQPPLPQHYEPFQAPSHARYPSVPQNAGFPEQEFIRHTPPAQQVLHQPPQQPMQHQQPMHHQQPLPQQQPTRILQRAQANPAQPVSQPPPAQPQGIQILQNPNRLSGEMHRQSQHMHPQRGMTPGHIAGTGPRVAGPMGDPQPLVNLSDEEKAAFLAEEAKRAKRNHKIFLLSKDNGIMTPQDKNFITRIQLQQLVTATGDPNEEGNDAALAEDFYYQVHNQIRGGPRQHPNQPLSNFAQTYLFQTGGRHGSMRRQARGADNHMQRMEQQVQRAVEAAKNKPKNKQLVIEGSLGKISFSNAKTPKPLLNIKRNDTGTDSQRPSSAARSGTLPDSSSARKAVLRDIENVYNTLMKLEDHDRMRPPPLAPQEINPTIVGLQRDWEEKWSTLNEKLWRELKVNEPVDLPGVTHPFIAFLSFNKGKRAIPRVFRHITQQQKTTILTMVVYHLDRLDVVRGSILLSDNQLSASIRESIELFSMAVMPSLFQYLSEAGLDIVDSILGDIILRHTNMDIVARTRVGVSMLTMTLSRAELIKQSGNVSEAEWAHWVATYDHFFNTIEPTLPFIFPGTVNTGEDVYVWQFLAAVGIGASPDQQQRLVLAVKDRVMETVNLAKTLPPAMAGQRLANVNLFMRSIGLDVELLA